MSVTVIMTGKPCKDETGQERNGERWREREGGGRGKIARTQTQAHTSLSAGNKRASCAVHSLWDCHFCPEVDGSEKRGVGESTSMDEMSRTHGTHKDQLLLDHNVHKDTHTDTHRHTQTNRHTDTQTG